AAETARLFRTANEALSRRLRLPGVSGADLWLARDRATFDELVRSVLGYGFHKAPSRRSLLAVSGRQATVVLSPSAYRAWSSYVFDHDTYARLIAHEVVHLYHFRADPQYLDAPPYWIEGLAVYLSGQWHTLPEFRVPVSTALRDAKVPSLEAITTDPSLAYSW